jgi:Ca-activated chloride channel homolog
MRFNTDSFVISIFLFFCVSNIAWIDPVSDRVEEGNRLYDQEKYVEAQKKYQDAQTLNPELMELYYNLANSLYKQEKYDDAEGLYNKVLDDAGKEMKADALHNLGNIKVKKNELEEALKYYRKSIRLDPSDEDTRMNYEQALQMLQQQQQQQQQQNQEDQDDKEKQDSEQDQQDQQEAEKDNQDSQNDQQQQDGKDGQESEQEQEKQEEGNQQEQQPPSQEDKQPLTEEQLEELKEKLKPDEEIEANPYLRALEKQEVENRKKQVYGDSKLYIEKDW